MANHKSAETRINRNSKKAIINGSRRSRVRTFIKKVEALIEDAQKENNKKAEALIEGKQNENIKEAEALTKEKQKENAANALRVAESELMKAVRKKVFALNTASRTVSRLSKKIKAL